MTIAWPELGFARDPREHDPSDSCASLLYVDELILGLLDAVAAASVIEVGALDGDLTHLLLARAERSGGHVTAVDPAPHPDLEQLADRRAELELIRQTSHEALAAAPLPDAVVLDGDHNHYTVSDELRTIHERCARERRRLPLLICHDVGWPHGRRDAYYVPERIPFEHRQPIVEGGGLYPGDPGIRRGAVAYRYPAAHEGGPGNGVLTAIDEFVAIHPELRLAIVPAFFGLGVIWERADPPADALERFLAPWDRNPHLARLERHRVVQMANTQLQLSAVRELQARLAEQDQALQRRRELLERMLDSRAFAAAERWLRIRHREPAFSREAIRAALR
jgi:Methyltransferase domain